MSLFTLADVSRRADEHPGRLSELLYQGRITPKNWVRVGDRWLVPGSEVDGVVDEIRQSRHYQTRRVYLRREPVAAAG